MTALATIAPSIPGMGSSRSPQTSITIASSACSRAACELAPEVSGAGVEVGLEADHDATGTDAGASSDQRVQHLGGVVGVVVVDPDVVGEYQSAGTAGRCPGTWSTRAARRPRRGPARWPPRTPPRRSTRCSARAPPAPPGQRDRPAELEGRAGAGEAGAVDLHVGLVGRRRRS